MRNEITGAGRAPATWEQKDNEKKRAVIAMSGGVDSSVAALLMQRDGYDCTGVTMRLFREAANASACGKSCCSDDDEADAAFVCHQLGIGHEAVCLSKAFEQNVIRKFIREYEAGRTPNPCVDCNRSLKFEALMDWAREEGFSVLATGHYARVRYDRAAERWQLLKAADAKKDQSYVLYMLTQEQLAHLRLPLGELRKVDARALAQAQGLVTAQKRDSQDICFIPDGDYADFIERWTGRRGLPGEIVDPVGRPVGRHRGLIRYTIGQRRGLGVPAGEAVYVIAKDPERNTLTVGPGSALYHRKLLAEDFNWLSVPELGGPIRVTARTRYHQPEASAIVSPLPGARVLVTFEEAQRAITPGQAVVLYQGELVVGGGTIRESFD